MQSLYARLFDTSIYSRIGDRNRAQISYTTVWLLTGLFTLYALLVPFRTVSNFEYHTYLYRALRPGMFPFFTFAFFGFYALLLITLIGLRRGYLQYVSLLPAIMVYLGGVSIAVQGNITHAQNAFLLIVALLVAGLLDGERGLLVFIPLHFVTIIASFIATFNNERIHTLPTNTIPTLILLLVTSTAIVSLLVLYHRTLNTDQAEEQVVSSRRRLQLADLTTSISRNIATSDNLNAALDSVVEDILEEFSMMYHVQVFLIDDTGRVAELVASTGFVGQQLLDRNHSLPVGSLSVIGQTTQRQEAIVAVVGGEDSVHRPNDLLPDTRLEVALPLNVGERNIGALDLQSKTTTVITAGDLTALRAVADSIAITIDNARLLEQTQQRLQENQRLLERMSDTQKEVERLNRELTGNIWSNYLRGQRHQTNFDIDFEAGKLNSADDFTEAIIEALNRGDVIRRQEGDKYIVAVPLRVRGEVIGAMEFDVEEDLSNEDMDMLREVGERLGSAAETNRLYENSQRIAQREALVNEIGTRIQSANTVEATLNEAVKSLRDALKTKRVTIQLGQPNGKGR